MRLRDRLREWWAPTPTPDVNAEQADEQADEDDGECMTCDAPAGPSGYCDDCERGVNTALYM